MAVLTPSRSDHAQIRPTGVIGKQLKRLNAYLMLGLSDLGSLVIAFLAANAIVNLGAPAPVDHGIVMVTVLAPLYAIQAGLSGAFSANALENPRVSVVASLRALALAAAEILFIAYLLKASGGLSRAVFAICMVGGGCLLTAGRLLLRHRVMALLNGAAHSVMILRDGVTYRPTGREAVVAAADLPFDPATSDPHAYHSLAKAVAGVDRLIVACAPDRAVLWASVLKSLTVDGEIFTDLHDELGAINLASYGQRRTIVVTAGPLNLPSRVLKRIFDLLLSIIGLILLSPLLIATAVAIRWESRGPVFFRQQRIGRDNRIFRIFKFRSMFHDQTDHNASALTRRGDARVTRVGAFIRRTSIDELPQLLNVLRGEMSIVGPRPHALSAKAADLLYWDVDVRYRHRHAIKPGLTGLAQVRGFRGNTEQIVDLTNRLQADLEYVAEWSLWRDVAIVLQTMAVMGHRNAY